MDAAAEVIAAELASVLDSGAVAEVVSGVEPSELGGGLFEGMLGLDSAGVDVSDGMLGSEIEGVLTDTGTEGLDGAVSPVVTVTTGGLSGEPGSTTVLVAGSSVGPAAGSLLLFLIKCRFPGRCQR